MPGKERKKGGFAVLLMDKSVETNDDGSEGKQLLHLLVKDLDSSSAADRWVKSKARDLVGSELMVVQVKKIAVPSIVEVNPRVTF